MHSLRAVIFDGEERDTLQSVGQIIQQTTAMRQRKLPSYDNTGIDIVNFPATPMQLNRNHCLCLAALTVLLSIICTGFYWQYGKLVNQEFDVSTDDIQALLSNQVQAPAKQAITLDQLQRLALMGKIEIEEPPAPPTLEEIPESTQMLELSGVFASEGTLAAALIKVDGNSPSYFTIGSEVTAGTLLFAVTNNGVTLKSENGYEKLIFKRNDIWAISTANTLQTAGPIPLIRTTDTLTTKTPTKIREYSKPEPIKYLPNTPVIADGTLEQRLNQIRAAIKR